MNLHIYPRPIYLSRCGEKKKNEEGELLGGDGELSERGHAYAQLLKEFLHGQLPNEDDRHGIKIFTSTRIAAKETGEVLRSLYPDTRLPIATKSLDELNHGVADGLSNK
jgi:broad specificity phosphatase PhoE